MDHLDSLSSKLRGLGRRVPPDVRKNLGPVELRVRCETASELLDKGKERDAVKVLEAMSLKTFLLGAQILSAATQEGRLKGNDPAVTENANRLDRLFRDHPQPVFDRVDQGDMSTVEAILKEISDEPAGRRPWWKFWRRSS